MRPTWDFDFDADSVYDMELWFDLTALHEVPAATIIYPLFHVGGWGAEWSKNYVFVRLTPISVVSLGVDFRLSCMPVSRHPVFSLPRLTS
jgi:hypothetical protein